MLLRKEFDLIRSILNLAVERARVSGVTRIENVHLAIGEIAGLDQNKIQSHWGDLSIGTPAEQAKLHFRLITAETQCMSCFEKYHPDGGVIHCPYCGSFGAKILKGEEFYLEDLE